MKIKQLSDRTGVSARLLRYYEEQGLLNPEREANGYRDYQDGSVERVEQIRGLLDAGLTTEIIRDVLPCLAEAAGRRYPEAGFLDRVRAERERMEERIACLTRNARALDDYLETVASRELSAAGAARASR